MKNSNLIRLIIEKLEEQSQLNVRSFKGYGVGHPYIDRKSTNLGKSKVREKYEEIEEKLDSPAGLEKVSVSRAFSQD